VTESEVAASALDDDRYNYTGSAAFAVVVGLGLALTARSSAVALLGAVAVVQALLALAWVYGFDLPGRRGALVIATMAAAAADTVTSVWPHGRLGALLAVFGLSMPVLFVHQLTRGAVRLRVVASLGGVAMLVLAEVSLAALLQLRHEFVVTHVGGQVVFGVVVASAGALVVGFLIDMVLTVPRFDADVPRGLLALLGSAGFGGSAGYLTLRHSTDFVGGRGAFAGAALGALVALFAVAVAFAEHDVPLADEGFARRVRPLLGVLIPLAFLAPVAFLLCLAIRS
jgi:hypothetical protein